MQYREFGKTGFNASALGFGCMRLPCVNGDDKQIDEEKAVKLIRYAIDHGVNYVDTAYPYHGGKSEVVVGKALKDGYREKVMLATKLPPWYVNSYEDFDKLLNEQLARLDTDHIDMYLLHNQNRKFWDKFIKLGIFKFIETAKKDGRIKHIGFSFHDGIDVFKEIVDAYDWEFCLIQYNYLDEYHQAGTEGLKYAAKKGMAVLIMEPLKGGRLAKTPPIAVRELWDGAKAKKTPAEWALRWVWNHPEVTTVLSGMNEFEQVRENLEIAENALPNSMSEEDIGLVNLVKLKYMELVKVQCTSCNYCMPCPAGVNIPMNFTIFNEASMYDEYKEQSNIYNNVLPFKQRAASCISCGKCEKSCPQHIQIRKHLKEIHNFYNSY